MRSNKNITTVSQKSSKSDKVAVVLNIILLCLLVVSFVWAFVGLFSAPVSSEHEKTKSDYLLTAWQSLLGILVLMLPAVLKKFRFIIPAYLRIVLVFYVCAAIFLGEVRSFYYRFEHWDTICHMSSGMIFTVISYSFVYLLNAKKDVYQKLSPGFVALFAFCFAATSGMVWEVMEFFIDSIFGCNMQKFIPMVDGIWNGGAGKEPLIGTNEQIAEFFRSPAGYKYALMDTMYDIIVDLFGALFMTMVCYVIMKFTKTSMDGFVITRQKLEQKTTDNIDDNVEEKEVKKDFSAVENDVEQKDNNIQNA